MSLSIDITSNIIEFEEALNDLKANVIVASTRRALNRTIINVRKQATKVISLEYSGLKAGEIKSVYSRMKKARGSDINKLESNMSFNSKSVSMIRMVVGSKQPRSQKGKKEKNRTPIRVQIKKGKKFIMSKAFIARVSAGDSETTHVFRRSGRKLYKQALPSVGLMLEKKGHLQKIGKRGQIFFRDTFANDMKFRLGKIAGKLDRAALRK